MNWHIEDTAIDTPTLIRMALRIADYYASYPDVEAIPGLGSHFARFWAPAMRADLAAAWSSWCSAEPAAAEARNAQLVTALLATQRAERSV